MDGRGRRGIEGQSLAYLSCPPRRIVERWTEVRPECPQYPVAMMTLECGHSDFYRGQKRSARCGQCIQSEPRP